MQSIDYRVWPDDPSGHYFRVTCRVTSPEAGDSGQVFRMPAWTPGSYTLRDHARFVTDVEARCGGEPWPVVRDGLHAWRCKATDKPIELSYRIYADDQSVRTAALDRSGAFFDGSGLFVTPAGFEDAACRISIYKPRSGAVDGEWSLATSMPLDSDGPAASDHAQPSKAADVFDHYRVDNFRRLIDHPVQMGDMQVIDFEAAGIPHRVSVLGSWTVDPDRLAADLQAICAWQIEYFDAAAPFTGYQFLLRVHDQGYGGLEHADSSALIFSRAALTDFEKGYQQLLELFSHEYFHAWNVKRMQPAAVAESDLNAPAQILDLWVFEGITSYLDGFTLLAAERIPVDAYLALVADQATRLARSNGRSRQTLEESSQCCWIGLYKPHGHSSNLGISYYNKGAIAALLIDLKLRRMTAGQLQLRDIMREALSLYGERPLADGAMEALILARAGVHCDPVQVADLHDFLDRLIRGVDELPLAEALAEFGVSVTKEADFSELGDATPPKSATASFGLRLATEAEFAEVRGVVEGSPAQAAGLSAGDQLLALDGLKLNSSSAARVLVQQPPNQDRRIDFFRRGDLQHVTLAPTEAPLLRYRLTLDSSADAEAVERRVAWLGEPGSTAT